MYNKYKSKFNIYCKPGSIYHEIILQSTNQYEE